MTYDIVVHVYNNNIIAIKMYDERRKFAARREPHSPYTHDILYYKRAVYIVIVYRIPRSGLALRYKTPFDFTPHDRHYYVRDKIYL